MFKYATLFSKTGDNEHASFSLDMEDKLSFLQK